VDLVKEAIERPIAARLIDEFFVRKRLLVVLCKFALRNTGTLQTVAIWRLEITCPFRSIG
jgi:hypothetical protein